MLFIVEVLSKVIGYSCFFYGLWKLIGEPFLSVYIKTGFRNLKRRKRVKLLAEINKENHEVKRSVIYKHLELTLSSISKKGQGSVGNFLFLVSIIFVVSETVLLISIQDVIISTLISLSFSVFPYIVIRFRLTALRLKTSLSFLNEFQIILQNYQTTDKDIYYTIYNSAKDIKDKAMKYLFMNVLSALQKERNRTDFKKAINVFVYSINSTFVKRFGKLLEIAHLDNADISRSLQDLSSDISKRKQDMSKDKTKKMETVIMGYAPIVTLPLVFFMGYKISGVINFWYIFSKRLPLTVFVVSVVLSIISIMLAYILSKPRADI